MKQTHTQEIKSKSNSNHFGISVHICQFLTSHFKHVHTWEAPYLVWIRFRSGFDLFPSHFFFFSVFIRGIHVHGVRCRRRVRVLCSSRSRIRLLRGVRCADQTRRVARQRQQRRLLAHAQRHQARIQPVSQGKTAGARKRRRLRQNLTSGAPCAHIYVAVFSGNGNRGDLRACLRGVGIGVGRG